MRREIAFDMPDTFLLRCRIRGEGPPNHVEFKVADPTGTNVWRHTRPDWNLPLDWQDWAFDERGLPFAWGPAGGGAPSEVGALEWVVAAGPGGRGFFEIASLELEDQRPGEPAAVRASSSTAATSPESAWNGSIGWRAEESDPSPWWEVDFGRIQRFGGVVIDWPESPNTRACRVEISPDGQGWKEVFEAQRAQGARSHLPVVGGEARYLRIRFDCPESAALRRVMLRPDAFSATPNEFIHQVAADYPRGWFPRYWLREQSYWTPVGSPHGRRRGLINEEGMVEVDEAGFSLEPVLWDDGSLVTWAGVEISQSMDPGGLPLPQVCWSHGSSSLEITPWVDGPPEALVLRVRYRLRGAGSGRKLGICVRPFQVNPPWQAFRDLGGRSPVRKMALHLAGGVVEGRRIHCTPPANQAGAAAFEESGGVLACLERGTVPQRQELEDRSELASAVWWWEVPAGDAPFEVVVAAPFMGEIGEPTGTFAAARETWQSALAAVEWSVPEVAREAVRCFRTAAGHILINRDNAAIQPGPRRYTRSWVRDCVIMGAALAKAGQPHALLEFLDWYTPFQRHDGFVPCVVDRDGVDWLVEHDSHGQLLWGMREALRSGVSPEHAANWWSAAHKAAEFLLQLRSERLGTSYAEGEALWRRGLLPESASHEGYLAHPVHSYWDDFWGIRGLEAAADLADALGHGDDAMRWRAEAAAFQADTLVSMERVIAGRGLNYLPGSVEWADFDPTATSNAIAQLDFADVLPPAPMEEMLATYLDGFRRKHSGRMVWNNYTAYEIRIIGAMVRLGKRAEAQELLEFFLSDRRPLAWNQWPEITWKNPRSPGHLGDVPHTWIAAEYLLAVAMMVASEREACDQLVLAPGLPWSWISSDGGFAVRGLPTRFGPLNLLLHGTAESIRVEFSGLKHLPVDGILLTPPMPDGAAIVAIDILDGEARMTAPKSSMLKVTSPSFAGTLKLG